MTFLPDTSNTFAQLGDTAQCKLLQTNARKNDALEQKASKVGYDCTSFMTNQFTNLLSGRRCCAAVLDSSSER